MTSDSRSSGYKLELDGRYLLSLANYSLNSENIYCRFCAHHFLEISLAKSGRGKYLVEGKSYDIRPGDVFLFNNIENHVLNEVYPRDTLVNMVVMFDPRFILSIENNLFDSGYLDIFFNRNNLFQNRLDRENPATGQIGDLLLEIESEFQRKLPRYEMMIKVKLLNILASLARHFEYIREDTPDGPKRSHDLARLNRVVDFIDGHLEDEIGLEDLAGQAFLNPSYFSSFFKKYMGMNPSEYIAKKRVNRAIELLRASNKTVLEISGLCGFNNTASFNRTFRRIVGKVPSSFRT